MLSNNDDTIFDAAKSTVIGYPSILPNSNRADSKSEEPTILEKTKKDDEDK